MLRPSPSSQKMINSLDATEIDMSSSSGEGAEEERETDRVQENHSNHHSNH